MNDALRTSPSGPAIDVAGAIRKYTVGPPFSGAEFETFEDAISQAVSDEPEQQAWLQIYPGRYVEDVVIPRELKRFVLSGKGENPFLVYNTAVTLGGVIIDGTLSIEIANGDTYSQLEAITVVGAVSVVQDSPPAPPFPSNVLFNVKDCAFLSTFTLTSDSASVGAIQWSSKNSQFVGLVTVTARMIDIFGGGMRSATLATERDLLIENTTLRGVENAWTFSSAARYAALYECREIYGRIVFNGLVAVMQGCTHNHNGSPAVTDNTTGSSFCQGNVFTHNAGPAGPVWIKTGPGIFHDGGNDFTEGQVYPWFSIAGTRTNRAESDIELRNILTLADSPILTPAQIGGQRKTTVFKSNGGGVVTLPPVVNVEPGCTVIVKDLNGNATASPFTVAGDGAETIDGAASYALSTNYAAVELQANGTGWSVIGSYL